MSTWIALTEKHIGLNNAEQVAYREALLRTGETDRLAEIITAAVDKVRGAIRSNRSNRLDPDATLIPASAAAYAVGYESASQFSREYNRAFGMPPSRDMSGIFGN